MKNTSKSKRQIIILISIIAILLLSVVITFTLAYLSDRQELDDDFTVGTFGLELYTNNGTTKLTATENTNGNYTAVLYNLTLSNSVGVANTVDLKMKNTGTISGIARVGVAIVWKDTDNILTNSDIVFSNTNFINTQKQNSLDPSINSMYFFMYYQNELTGGSLVSIIDTITLQNSQHIGKQITIKITIAEAIPYSGNEALLGQVWTTELEETINQN